MLVDAMVYLSAVVMVASKVVEMAASLVCLSVEQKVGLKAALLVAEMVDP